MAAISTWSKTAASNNSAAPDGFPEAMAPSGVNDAARELMAAVRTQWEKAEWFDWGDTPTRTADTTFTIAGDVTSRYTVHRRLMATGSSTTYHNITASSYGAPDTTVTVDGTLPGTLTTVELGIVNPTNATTGTFQTLVIEDSGATDTVTFSHDGTNLLATGVNTSSLDLINMGLRVRGGNTLTVLDSTDTDSLALNHDGANANFVATTTTNIDWIGGANFRLRDGASLFLFDGTDADSMELSHDGTNVQVEFANTTDIRWRDGIVMRQYDSTDVVSSSVSQTLTSRVVDLNVAASQMVWRSLGAGGIHIWYTGGAGPTDERFRLGDGYAYVRSGGVLSVFNSDNASSLAISHDGTDGQIDTSSGDLVLGSASGVISSANRIETTSSLYVTSDTGVLRLGAGNDVDVYFDGTAFRVRTVVGTETMIAAVPNAAVSLYYDSAETARTVTAATGGLEVNNTLTGGGFEAVATISEYQGVVALTVGGFSADPTTRNLYYTVIGNICHCTLDMDDGTSNGTTFTFTNIPAAIQPADTQLVYLGHVNNNSGPISGCTIAINGGSATWTLGAGHLNAAGGGWTAINSKGMGGFRQTFSYHLDYQV